MVGGVLGDDCLRCIRKIARALVEEDRVNCSVIRADDAAPAVSAGHELKI